MSTPLRILLISDGSAGAAAARRTIDAHASMSVARIVDGPDSADAALSEGVFDVVVMQAQGKADARRQASEAIAARHETPFVVVNATEGRPGALLGIRQRVWAAAAPGARCGDVPKTGLSRVSPPVSRSRGADGAPKLIAIGSSTGGVEALIEVLRRFPANTPPTVLVQHMPGAFTGGFAQRLDTICAAQVVEAWNGAPLETGRVYLAPGGAAHLEVEWGLARRVRLIETAPVNRHRPSVDVAFDSIVRANVRHVAAALLTGMGRDGAAGLKRLRDAGARTVAQDERTSTVYGMPRAALELGAVDRGTPLEAIADAIFQPNAAMKETL